MGDAAPTEAAAQWTVVLVADDAEGRPITAGLARALADHGGRLTTTSDHAAVALVAVGDAGAALDIAAARTDIRSVVLVDADVSPEACDLIAELHDAAILTVIDPALRACIVGAVDGHLASTHRDSSLVVEARDDVARAEAIARWLANAAESATTIDDITIHTADGWVLGADVHRPAGDAPPAGWPAVVLMHSGRSDRTVFDRLSRLLARHGVVALALDWRGRGTSTNLGHFVDFTSEQQAGVRNDVTAAYDHLESMPGVDGSRLGILGIAHGAGYAADGALTDERTRAIVMMTAYHLAGDAQQAALRSGRVNAMFVTCEPHAATTRAMRDLFELTDAKGSRLVTYPEGVLGYQLFDLHPDLEPSIASWFAEVLS
ncbi:MAG: alpha/beta hydrolase [Ilumatobacteraceae bacterium]